MRFATILHIGGGIGLAAVLAHDLRVDYLRGQHLATANRLLAAANTAIEAGKRLETLAKENADDTDKRAVVTVAGLRDSVLRLPTATASCATQARDSQGTDRPGAGAVGDDQVTVPRADMLICATNTGRLLEAHDWALRTEGLLQSGGDAIQRAEQAR